MEDGISVWDVCFWVSRTYNTVLVQLSLNNEKANKFLVILTNSRQTLTVPLAVIELLFTIGKTERKFWLCSNYLLLSSPILVSALSFPR